MTKKVEVTKAELVRQVEQKFRLPKFALNSLERANKETIKVILSQQSTDVSTPQQRGFLLPALLTRRKICAILYGWRGREAFTVDYLLGERARLFIYVLSFSTQVWHFGAARASPPRWHRSKPVRTGPAPPSAPRPLIWGRFEIRLSLLMLSVSFQSC